MPVILKGENKSLEFSVVGYQFLLEKEMDRFDANWLTVKILYTEDDRSVSWQDSCLLSDELADLAAWVEAALSEKETAFTSNFLEPYLEFSLRKTESLSVVQIRFVYDAAEDWKEVSVAQNMTREELCEMQEALRDLSRQFPYRNVNCDTK